MKVQESLLFFCLLTLAYMLACARGHIVQSTTLSRSSFPNGFIFEAGSSAFRVDGAAHTDGREPSIWDTFTVEYPGIQPLVTLFHWDLPQALEDEYGGFLSYKIVNDYRDYADFCFQVFGDRGMHSETAPVRCSDYVGNCTAGNSATEPYIVVHHLLPSHASAVKIHKDRYQMEVSQKGSIGITVYGSWMTASEMIYICPKGIQRLLLYLKRNYNNPPIYITENEMPDSNNYSLSVDEALNDGLRIKFYSLHLSYLLKAIKKGVDVTGYYIWAFLDNFEWMSGYTLRFGITYVDYNNQLERFPKLSALWFKKFLQKGNQTNEYFLLYSEE
ncbi:vicianin hydrolase-like [Hevea brasiliensis]|nr:vicianin hydrolase-like [Hevea brasiliensis]